MSEMLLKVGETEQDSTPGQGSEVIETEAGESADQQEDERRGRYRID